LKHRLNSLFLICDTGETPWPDNVQLFQPYEGLFTLLMSLHTLLHICNQHPYTFFSAVCRPANDALVGWHKRHLPCTKSCIGSPQRFFRRPLGHWGPVL